MYKYKIKYVSYVLVYIYVFVSLTEQYDPSHYDKLTHMVYYKYQQRSLRR